MKMHKSIAVLLRMALAVLTLSATHLSSTCAFAGLVVPSGLNPGDTYYLAFITADARGATSTSIADYNQFAQNEASHSSLTGTDDGVQWRVIGSTATVDAMDNLSLDATSPIYLLDGVSLVANGATGLWSGSILHAIDLNQYAEPASFYYGNFIYTGTLYDGRVASERPLGSTFEVEMGSCWQTTLGRGWLDCGYVSPSSTLQYFYAVSTLITVVPEPSTLSFILLGMVMALGRCSFSAWKKTA